MVKKGYIDREVAFDMITDLAGMATTKAAYAAIWKSAKELNKIPAADVAPIKHGKWIYDCWCEFKCSECGEHSNSKPYKGKEKYCPNCGAKMDGGDNE